VKPTRVVVAAAYRAPESGCVVVLPGGVPGIAGGGWGGGDDRVDDAGVQALVVVIEEILARPTP
jgi:hypothetical protein